MRTPEEIEDMVCRIVKFKKEKQPWDLETMVICIKLAEGYQSRAKKILGSLKKHREGIPKEVIAGVEISVITSTIAEEGGRIRKEMERLVEDFLRDLHK